MNLRSLVKHTSRRSTRIGVALAGVAAFLPVAAASAAVTQGPGCTDGGSAVTCEFWAVSGTKAMPGGGTVSVMGYSATAGGAPILPGPAIVADEGDSVTVTLHNDLVQPTGMLFQEQALSPDRTGVAAGGTRTYTFSAAQAGTYLYEASPFVATSSGGGSQYQTAMGMYGALVVRPSTAGQAYASADSAFDEEHLVVVGELDKDLTAANAATFDMRKYSPEYFLLNGTTAPATDDLSATAGQKVLLRMVNGSVDAHSMGLLGLEQTVVGEDGNALANPRHVTAETIIPGQTSDVIVGVPASASGRYPVYDTGLWLNNASGAGTGGMLAFLAITPGPAAPDTAGPATTDAAFDLGTGALTANVSDAATGGAGIQAAEFFIDSPGAPGTGTPMSGPPGTGTVGVSYTFGGANPPFPTGSHTIYVRGQDDVASGNWGPVSSVIVVNTDTAGPLTKALTLTPNPSNGSKNVQLKATGDDTDSGGSNIAAGEYTIDGGAPVALTPNIADPISALDTTILAADVAALDEGSHIVSVRSQDIAGNWGEPVTINLLKDETGPDTSPPTASRTVVSGTPNYSTNTQFMQVTATITDAPHHEGSFPDANSNVAAGEGFIDSVGVNGTGFPLVPRDGAWNSPSESVRGDVPLDTLAALSEGAHTIYLHGRDSSGNWGVAQGVTVTVDKTGPTVAGLAASPNPTNVLAPSPFDAAVGNATTFGLAATATDTFSAVTQAEWFSGADPGPGNGTPVAVAGANLNAAVDFGALGWLDGSRVISVRAGDSLGNWGPVVTTTVAIVRPNVIFQNAFPNGPIVSPTRWSAITGAARLTFPGTGAARLMQVRLSGPINAANPASAYVTDNSPVAEPTYHGRYYFNPNNSIPGGGANGVIILRGYTGNNGGGSLRFTVRYRLNAGLRQVRLDVARAGGTTSTNWFTVANAAATRIEVFWEAVTSTSTTAVLTVDPPGPPTGAATLPGLDTGTGNRIESVRFGVQGLAGLPATRAGSLRLDSFASARRTVVGP